MCIKVNKNMWIIIFECNHYDYKLNNECNIISKLKVNI